MQTAKQQKKVIRQLIRKKRQTLSIGQQKRASQKLLQQLLNDPTFMQARNIAIYLASDGEISQSLLLTSSDIRLKNKQFFVPIVQKNKSRQLHFTKINKHTTLKRNRYGIFEPKQVKPIQNWILDLVLMPLVAFTKEGLRLGMGGGFYDTTFSKNKTNIKQPKLIGIAHSFQCVPFIPNEPWDLPIKKVINV
ncbi:MAG: 5-formyltetrahydrofolate cyclo-ligase [Saccharospirillaceae bacterium]|nr:5-formyltetrahydrofolate cyclo-ligase [Pseudomonadales bacterium]NRB80557.1 5-formyltetrahydrofolate cyclo-ligase [Saccharospirillaceae bacterium]